MKNSFRCLPVPVTIFIIVGLLTGSANAESNIDITKYKETFSEAFREGVDVTPWGPSRWIAHTPWHGDFGASKFANPQKDFPFLVGKEGLQIIAKKSPDGHWESGLLSSRDDKRRGFSQSGGYFEARMKMPSGPSAWPAFWLGSEGDGIHSIEIDVLEYHGHWPDQYQNVVHVWSKKPGEPHSATIHVNNVPGTSLVDEFHTYGVEIRENEIVFYLDRHETWRTPAPPVASQPVMILLDLALAPEWQMDETHTDLSLSIDYVKAFLPKP